MKRAGRRTAGPVFIALLALTVLVGGAPPAWASATQTSVDTAALAAPQTGATKSGAYVAGWEAVIDHDVYYLTSFTSPFDQPWEPTHEVEFAHEQGSASFMYLEIPRSIESIARGDHDDAITEWFERWCEVAWVHRDVVAPLAEMNGDWTTWSAVGRPETYKEAYRRIQELAPCHVRWAYAPSAFRGWRAYFPGDDVEYIPFVAVSAFAWSCGTSAESIVKTADRMRRHFNKPTILAQTGTACATGRAEWHADLFARAGDEGIYAVIPGHFPNGGQPHEPWDNPGWEWALQFTENSAWVETDFPAEPPPPPPEPPRPRVARTVVRFV